MRLPAWLLWAATAVVTIISAEDTALVRVKRRSSEKRIVCYYTNWSVYRPGTAKFSPQNINPYLCTHLIYAFGGLTKDNSLKPFDKYQDIEQGGYAKFNGLKSYNKNLKTLVAIGGWNEGSARFSPLVADSDRRKELVKNTLKFLRQNHFDGLDLDWEYPSFRDGGKPRDRDNYAALVQELREEFDRESQKTGRPRLLLTMAVPAGIEYIDKGYDVPRLNKYLDWMNILSYDYHSAFEPTVNHHAPLFSLEEDDEYNFDAQLNIDHTVQHYIKLGADRNKLVLGIPTYGRSYTLFNPEATDLGAAADGPGEQGEATREKGYLAYYEICERIKGGDWEVKSPNPEAMGPFAYKGNQWVGYDDEEIVRAKAKYVNDNDLGGIMFWSIDNDDFRGKCHGKPYPLIEAAKESLLATSNELIPSREYGRSNSRTQEVEHTTKAKSRKTRLRAKTTTTSTTTESARTRTTPAYSTTTPLPPTTPDPGSDFVCKDEGFFPHPRDCKKYFWCLDSGPSSLGIVAHQFTCPSGLVFNKISDSCDYPRNVVCKNKPDPTTTTTTTTTSKTTTSRSGTITPSPRTTSTTTTTTTTEEPEYEEYEVEDEEEDPGTIKELLSLIKKLGGVEQLEKQLNLQDSDENKKIKPSLYNKFLSGRPGNKYRGANDESSTSKYVSLFRNRPAGAQSPSSEETNTNTKHAEKPQYVTINRSRSTTKAPKEEEEEEDEEVIEEEAPKSKPSRRRPANDVSTEKEYVTVRRFRPQKEEATTPRYKSILRTRSTTEAPTVEEESEEEIDEEEKESESLQKDKKYSSVIRENKRIVSEVDESKVSGRRGPQYQREKSTPRTSDLSNDRNPVNNNNNNYNVYTSPKYVEIRRGHSTTTEAESSTDNVNNVNSSEEKVQTEGSRTEGRTRFTLKPSTVEQTTPYTINPVTRSRGRFRIITSTEATTTTRNRNSNEVVDSKVEDNTKSSQSHRRRGGSLKNPTTEGSTQTSRGLKFPPRKVPSRNQKVYDNKTGEYFTVIFPETTEYPNSGEVTTLDPTEPTTVDPTTETDLPVTYFQTKKTTRLPKIVLSTSTETSVVTSVTESLFTERHKISVTKKPFFKSTYDKLREKSRVTSTETPSTRSRYRLATRSTTPKIETTSRPTPKIETTSRPTTRGLRSRTRATTTTTQAPQTSTANNRRFESKKTRGYKKFTDGNSYENSDSIEVESIERNNRFLSRGRSASSDTLLKRTGEVARRRGTSPRKQNDDLDTQQSAAFYDDDIDIESDQKFLLGGTVKQTSGKDFLNADVLFVTVPSVEEEEKKSSTQSSRRLNKIVSVKSKDDGRSQEDVDGRYRGRVKAKESLTNDLDGGVVTGRSKNASYKSRRNEGEEAETETSEAPSSTTTTTTTTTKSSLTSHRRGNHDYLNSLRGRTRSTTTTQSPSTSERPTRRPTSQTDRRRYRPETRSTTSKPDLTATNSTRQHSFPRRRTRPTTSTTEAVAVSEENGSRIEGSIDDVSDLPDLADPAVVAIHNLATASPGPGASSIATTPIRVASESPRFTIHVSPTTEASFSSSVRPVSTPVSFQTSRQTSFRPFVSSTVRQFQSSSTQFPTRAPSTPVQVTPISPITEPLSARTEVVIQPRRQDTVVRQRTTTLATTPKEQVSQPRRLKPFSKVPKPGVVQAVSRPNSQQSPEYEYYDDSDVIDDPLADVPPSALKVKVHSDGYIECLDRGNFPHPFSCKKFISCAKMENNDLLGWEYTCPKHLSFDPVGGICNWSAGLGCQH